MSKKILVYKCMQTGAMIEYGDEEE